MRELFFHILNGAAVRIGGAIKRIGSAPGAKYSKKELDSRIATKIDEIRTLKAGLSGIVKQHGFATVQDFYTAFYTAQNAFDQYQKDCARWDKTYGEKATPRAETMHEKIQRYQEKADRQNASQPFRNIDKGAR